MKTDARVRYTKIKIKESFFTLLAQKEFPLITVTELCDLAEINRGTFYKHYTDMEDLLRKTEDDIFKTVRKTSHQLSPKNSVDGMEKILTDLSRSQTAPVFLLFRADSQFSNQISEYLCQDFSSHFMEISDYTPHETAMIHRFMIYGCASIIRSWLLSDESKRLSPRELAVFLFTMTEKITH